MAFTSKSRVARHRAKIKENPEEWENHLKKERERDSLRRLAKRKSMTGNSSEAKMILKKKRLDDKKRQQICRAKRKADKQLPTTPSTPTAYRCPQTRGKAVSRARRMLPTSPRKRLEVAKNLLIKEMPSAATLLKKRKTNISPKQISADICSKVTDFYQLDSISRQEPGKRDVLSLKDNISGKRNHFQKRIMLMKISEAYEVFKDANPTLIIKKSKFFSLRPKFVLPMANMPHNVCVCMYHANMDYLIQAIHSSAEQFPTNGNDLIDALVCNSETERCMNSECEDCNDENGKCLENLVNDGCLLTPITWKVWQDMVGRPQLCTIQGTIKEAIIEIKSKLKFYLSHVYIKRVQATAFECAKSNLEPGVAVLQMDFAENYSATSQDEIQSAHWSHSQITIYTAVAWMPNGIKRCFAVVSNELQHGKVAVWVFMKTIIKELKIEFPDIFKFKIFTDGCAAQFKNRFTLSNIMFAKQDFGVIIEWSFFASSHGKGAVDGVGGIVKRNVWLRVKARQAIVNTAEDFANCARECFDNINVMYVTAEHVASHEDFLTSRWKDVLPIPRLQSIHFITACEEGFGTLNIGFTNNSEMKTVAVIPTKTVIESSDEEESCRPIDWTDADDQQPTEVIMPEPYVAGTFVLVGLPVVGKGKGSVMKKFYAEIIEVDEERDYIMLKYMLPSGKNFYVWPEKDDVSCERISGITLQKVNHPVLKTNRGQFQFCKP